MKSQEKPDVHVFVVRVNIVTMGAVVAPPLLTENISAEPRGATGVLIVPQVTPHYLVVNQVAQVETLIQLHHQSVRVVDPVVQEEHAREHLPVVRVIGCQDFAHVIQPVSVVFQIRPRLL